MNKTGNVVLWRDCRPSAPCIGGGLRSAQIAGVVNALDIEWMELATRRVKRPLRDALAGVRLRLTTPGAGHMQARMRRRVGNRLAVFESLARELGLPGCVLWENTKDHSLLLFARRHAVPVIALPHNIESLGSPEQIRYAQSGVQARFCRELQLLAQADRVFTISTWDQWLLRLFAVESSHLPYAPPAERLRSLDGVREARRQRPSAVGPLIVVGSATYGPSRRGMCELLGVLDGIAACRGIEVVVAGFGTEAFQGQFSPHIDIRGGVSDETLLALYAEARAGIVYQPPASGALTRIADLLAADVPVLANTHAARSYRPQPGLTVFDDFDVLAHQLQANAFPARIESSRAARGPDAGGASVLQDAIRQHLNDVTGKSAEWVP